MEIVNPSKDEQISKDSDFVYILGGYIETQKAYDKIMNSKNFKDSLLRHVKDKRYVYAECAGLLFLSKNVDDKKMMNILDVSFTLTNKRNRLGYYYNQKGLKGHAFHYTKPIDTKSAIDILSKKRILKESLELGKKRMYMAHIYIQCLEII